MPYDPYITQRSAPACGGGRVGEGVEGGTVTATEQFLHSPYPPGVGQGGEGGGGGRGGLRLDAI